MFSLNPKAAAFPPKNSRQSFCFACGLFKLECGSWECQQSPATGVFKHHARETHAKCLCETSWLTFCIRQRRADAEGFLFSSPLLSHTPALPSSTLLHSCQHLRPTLPSCQWALHFGEIPGLPQADGYRILLMLSPVVYHICPLPLVPYSYHFIRVLAISCWDNRTSLLIDLLVSYIGL